MADLYVCSHGQTKPCDQCTAQLENKLGPCPFCGRKMTMTSGRSAAIEAREFYNPSCEHCNYIFQDGYYSIEDAIKAANSRAPVVPQEARCGVSVTGRHRIDPPYCKDCGQTFAPSPSSPVPAEQGDSHQSEQWKRDLIAAGWVAESAIKWRAPDGSLWRGPYGAWKELQRQRENCSGCAVSRAGVGRCRIHEPVNPAATPAPVEQEQKPIDMILFCPRCGTQHVDAPESDTSFRHRMEAYSLTAEWQDRVPSRWTNPPHRSHLCHNCCAVWRPADIPTNGVAQIKTRGKEDNTWTNSAAVPATPSPSLAAREAAEAAKEIVGPYTGKLECPWCTIHPHRDPCTFACGEARLNTAAYNRRLLEVAEIITRHCSPVPAAGGDEDAGLHDLLRHVLACAGDTDCETCAEAKKIANGESTNA